MDDLDLMILRELTEDGRLSMSELANRVHLSRAQIYRRVDALKEAGVLRGFSADVDWKRVGLPVNALVLVQVHQGRWEEVHDAVQTIRAVQYAAATAGEFDLVMLVRVESVDALRDVVLGRLALLDGVRNSRTLMVLDELIGPRSILPSSSSS